MRFPFLLMTGFTLVLSGCAAGAVGAMGVATVQERSMGAGFDDANASNELKSKLFAAGPRRFEEVDVEVSGGLGLLTGRVSTEDDKAEAEQMAWSVRRIIDVANELNVSPPGSVRDQVNDEWITTRVRTRLVTDGNIRGINYNIETYNGVVYLMGIAQNNDELRRAAEHASFVRGVREVVSYVELKEERKRPYMNQNAENVAGTPAQ